MGGAVGEKKIRKEALEEELAKADSRTAAAPVYGEKEKTELREKIVQVAAERAIEEKRENAWEEQARLPRKPAAEPSALKPEKGAILESESLRMKSADYSSKIQVKADSYRVETKAAELGEKELEERVRSESSLPAPRGARLAGGSRMRDVRAERRGKVLARIPAAQAAPERAEEKRHDDAVVRVVAGQDKKIEVPKRAAPHGMVRPKAGKKLPAGRQAAARAAAVKGGGTRIDGMVRKLKGMSGRIWKR
jgi:hypothetical protein